MYLMFLNKTRHKSVFRDNSKIIVTGKEMSKLLSCEYLTTHYNMAKCHQNVEKRLIESSRGKIMIAYL